MLKAIARGRHTKAACLTAAILVLSHPTLVAAQPGTDTVARDEVALAERNAAEAFDAYRAGHYGTAVALYVQAYNATPNADILYNIARIYDTKLGDRKLAMTFYRRYIADPGALADRIKLANERLVSLREAEIAADDSPAPRDGASNDGASNTDPSNARRRVSAGPAQAQPDSESARTWSTQELFGVIVGAAGVVGVGIGAGFGVAALSDAGTARDLCDGNACREQRGVTAARNASQNARVSTVGFAAGAALLGIGTALFLSADKPTERPQVGRLRWAPLASKSSVALGVSGAW
jgi:tetratricopeptide (TPR) repeat protein